jgi:large subunit ribosomal protein L6
MWVVKFSQRSGEVKMSRIGKAIISIPAGVKVAVNGQNVQVEGPLGKLSTDIHELIKMSIEGNTISFARPDDLKFSRAIHGTTRALVANMVEGVTKGFKRLWKLLVLVIVWNKKVKTLILF